MKTSDHVHWKLIEGIEDYAILFLDAEGNIVKWNKGAEKINGYKAKEVIGKNFSLFYTQEDREKKLPEQLISKATLQEQATDEGWRMKKDGTCFWGSINIIPVYDEDHKVAGYSQITRDLTEKKSLKEVETRLEHTRENALKIFNASPSMMIITDIKSLKFIEVNQIFLKIFEYNKDEIIGFTADELGIISKEIRQKLTDKLNQFGYLKDEEIVCHTKSRKKIYCLISTDLFEMNDGKCFLSVFHDITQMKVLEKKIVESEKNYKRIIEEAGDVLYTTDPYGIFTYINKKAAVLTEYSVEELIGQHFSILISPEWQEKVRDAYMDQFQKRVPETSMEFLIRTKTGQEKWVEQVVVMQTEANFIKGFHCVVRDITERKKADLLLKDNEEQIRKLVEFQNVILNGTDYSIITTNLDGVITTFNKGAEKMLGYTKEEVVGIATPAIIHDFSEIERRAKILSEELQMTVEPGIDVFHIKPRLGSSIETNEWTYICKDGSRITVELSITALRDKSNNVMGYLGVAKDITQQLKNEQELIKAKQEAEQSVILKETFLANMSHEIRTPMNAIIGFTDLLLKRNLSAQEKEYVQTVKSSGENLLRIINDILDISKIDSGVMTFEEHPISISEFFVSINNLLSKKAKEKNLNLSFKCDENVPHKVVGDPTRLTQIVLNLVGNAIKFTKHGSVEVFVKLLKEENDICYIKFSVTDTGIGIPEDKLQHVFERFRQAESHTTRYYGGTGLGLSIAKQLVDLQGGKMTIESVVGKGSVFSFELPFKKANSVHISKQKEEKEHIEFNVQKLVKFNILVVEDNPINVKFILSLFLEYDIKADVAENGKRAIEKIKNKSYDIILMDIEMPEMNGYETASFIRNDLKSTIPIIAMTAHAMAGEREKCLNLGMNDYISKPINSDRLFEKMLVALSSKINEGDNDARKGKMISMDFLLTSMRGKTNLVVEVIDMFLKHLPHDLAMLDEAIINADYLTVKDISHKMRSSVSMMGIVEMDELLKNIETLGASENGIEKIKYLNLLLQLHSDQVVKELQIEKIKYA
ncbi:MAG TPA: PAS domain S-box protein [Bacteroidia bacterium]|nr:PAS domain S-box protein [Bacteroidia bacterium]